MHHAAKKPHGISLRRRTTLICCWWKSLAVTMSGKQSRGEKTVEDTKTVKDCFFLSAVGLFLKYIPTTGFCSSQFSPCSPSSPGSASKLPASVSLSATLIPQDFLCCKISHLAQIVWRTHIVPLQLTFFYFLL